MYAEDPRAGFLPTGGRVEHVRHPSGEGVRVDSALEDGLDVSIDYDPMLAKVIAWGPDRDAARRRLVRALDETAVFGVTTNIEFLRLLLELPAVVRGDLDTGLIGRELDGLAFADPDAAAWAEAALLLDAHEPRPSDPWHRRDGWRLGPAAPRVYALRSDRGERAVVRVWGSGDDVEVAVDDGERQSALVRDGRRARTSPSTGTPARSRLSSQPARVEFTRRGATFRIGIADADHAVRESADEQPHLDSPMPGTVVMVAAVDGARRRTGGPDRRGRGHEDGARRARHDRGTVRCTWRCGDQVARGQTLATVTAARAPARRRRRRCKTEHMPESPEVQVLAEFLDGRLRGRTVQDVDLVEFRALKTRARPLSELAGQSVEGVERIGKHVDVRFADAAPGRLARPVRLGAMGR